MCFIFAFRNIAGRKGPRVSPDPWYRRGYAAWALGTRRAHGLAGRCAWWRAGQARCEVNSPQLGKDRGALQGVPEATRWKTTEISVLGCWAVFIPLWLSCRGPFQEEQQWEGVVEK